MTAIGLMTTRLSDGVHELRSDDIRNTVCGRNIGGATWETGRDPVTCPDCLFASPRHHEANEAVLMVLGAWDTALMGVISKRCTKCNGDGSDPKGWRSHARDCRITEAAGRIEGLILRKWSEVEAL